MSYYGVFIPSKSNFEGSVEQCSGSVAAINYKPVVPPDTVDNVATGITLATSAEVSVADLDSQLEDPEYPTDSPLWLVFLEKPKALDVLRQYKEARLREFATLEEAERYVQFGFESVQSLKFCGKVKKINHAATLQQQQRSNESINSFLPNGSDFGISISNINNNTSTITLPTSLSTAAAAAAAATASSNNITATPSSISNAIGVAANAERPPFRAPTKQELVEFRKSIEAGDYNRVYRYIWDNPRYLISSGDTPTNLKEGYRYNAMHICAQFNQPKIAELILQVVSNPRFANRYTGKRANPQTSDTLNKNLLDYYLNIPDKGRSETPLHFASKNGHVQMVALLTAYPECKSMSNKEGQFPKDIICQRVRNPDPEAHKKIEQLLSERFFVPVWRTPDPTIPAVVGEPFSSNNLPNFDTLDANSTSPLAPKFKIKALAGPMGKEQADKFCRRWKTPPRINTNHTNGVHHMSPSPSHKASLNLHLSPFKRRHLFSPKLHPNGRIATAPSTETIKECNVTDGTRVDAILANEMCSLALNGNHTNKDQETAASDSNGLESTDMTYIVETNNNINGNQTNSSTLEHYEKYGTIAFPYTPRKKHLYMNYRTVDSSPIVSELLSPEHVNMADSLLDDSITGLNESLKERHIKNTDFDKGLEVVGRQLAKQENVEWSEYWDFLNAFVDISTPAGLEKLESYFMERTSADNAAKQSGRKPDFDDICNALAKTALSGNFINADTAGAAMNNIENFDSAELMNSTLLPSSITVGATASQFTATNPAAAAAAAVAAAQASAATTIPQVNTPYTCVEKSLQVFAKRMTKTIINNINNVVSINDTLLSELKRLKSLISSFKQDARFYSVDFSKVHARIGNLVAIYIEHSQEVMLATKLKIQSILRDLLAISNNGERERREQLECVCTHILQRLEQSSDQLPDNLKTEELCLGAWSIEKACPCPWDANLSRKTSRRKRTESFYAQQQAEIKEASNMKNNRNKTEDAETDDELFWSDCADDSEDELYITPPQSPVSEPLSEEDLYKIYIFGDEPTKRDLDVLSAITCLDIDKQKYACITAWMEALQRFSNEEIEHFPSPAFIQKTHKPRIVQTSGVAYLRNQEQQQQSTPMATMPLLPLNKSTQNSKTSVVTPIQKKDFKSLNNDELASNNPEEEEEEQQTTFLSKIAVRGKRLFSTPKLATVAAGAGAGHHAVLNVSPVQKNIGVAAALAPAFRTPIFKARGLFTAYRDKENSEDDSSSSCDNETPPHN